MRQDVDAAASARGAGDRFLDFLEHDIIPLVERDYRTTGRRLIAGHSRGGLLVVYALMARPALFAGFLAHSPALWREEGALVTAFESWLASRRGLGGFLYISVGSEEVPRMRAGFTRLTAVLARGAGDAGLRWASDVVPGANHQANGPWASPLGLAAYFGAWQTPATTSAPEPSR
jgi:predicted alpha/beta superfamily hydrolase